jgi:hypothetical protein
MPVLFWFTEYRRLHAWRAANIPHAGTKLRLFALNAASMHSKKRLRLLVEHISQQHFATGIWLRFEKQDGRRLPQHETTRRGN